MPLYSDANYYYTGGSSQLFAPYYPSGVYSIPSVSSAYAPYTSSYNRPMVSSYLLPSSTTPRSPSYTTHGISSRYQPKLSTIGETSTLMTSSRHSALLPLTRTHSPKIKSYSTASSTTLHSKYIPPRPININTADIDVSSARHRRQRDEVLQREIRQSAPVAEEAHETSSKSPAGSKRNSLKNEVDTESANADNTEESQSKHMRSTIRRNRPVVRLSTVRMRNKDIKMAPPQDKPQQKMNETLIKDEIDTVEEKIGWRQKLANDLALLAPSQTKKSPGQRLKERFLIQETKTNENEKQLQSKEAEQLMEEVVVQVDPVSHICHVSLPSGPSFHDICADISSDKIDDDLNAGALRKRASIILEQETQLLNQLQQSASGSFQLIHLERRGSHDSNSNIDEPQENTRASKRISKERKKIKHKITAIVDVQNAPLTTILQEKEEELLSPTQKISPKQNISYNLDDVQEHHQMHKVFKLPKKKSVKRSLLSKNEKLPTGFLEPIPKAKRASKSSKHKKFIDTTKIFTFDQESIQKQKDIDLEQSSYTNNEKQKVSADELQKQSDDKERRTIENEQREKQSNLEKKTRVDSVLNVENNKKPEDSKSVESALKTSSSLGMIAKSSNVTALKTSKSLDSTATISKSNIIKEENFEKSKLKEEKLTESINHEVEKTVVKPKPIRKIIKQEKSNNTGNALEEKLSDKIKEEEQPSVATPKPIRKVIKSESSEDFWSYIGTRETVYMANRKNVLQETSKPRIEMMTEPSKMSESLVKHNLQIEKKQTAHSMDTIEETILPKVEIMKEPFKISQPIEKHNLPDEMKQFVLKKELKTEISLTKLETMVESSSIVGSIDEKKVENKLPKVKQVQKEIADQTTKPQSFKEESTESLKVIETPRAKIEKPNNKNTCIMDKIPKTIPTKTPSDTILPKIQSGKVAKSPEKQQENLPKATLKTVTTIATTTTTSTTTTTTTTLDEHINNCKMNKINTSNINLATTTTTITTQPKTITKTATTTPTTGGVLTTQTKLATTTTSLQSAISKTTIANKVPTTKECELNSIAEVENKTQSLTTKSTSNVATKITKDSPLKNTTINKAKTSPINADGFITMAPVKSTNISPTIAKNKSASPKNKITIATTTTTIIPNATILTDKVTMTTNATSTITTTTTTTAAASTTMATAATTMATSLSNATTIAKTVAASNQIAKIATSDITTITTQTTEATKTTSDKSHGGNNLSKFATVLDLAQCLRDVDADLEDYIPSSAENSNDEDNLTDDSTFYCSSVDGCENLSASMKKKLKQKKRKEKQAQEARFDPHKKIKIDTTNKCYVKDEAPRYPLVATPRPLWKREKIVYSDESSDDSDSDESGSTEETEDSEECTSNSEEEYENSPSSADVTTGSSLASTDNSSIIRMSTCSNDSGFEGGTAPSSPKKMLGECKISIFVCTYYV